MKRTRKITLSESQKRELLLSKLRQIIREEIERSIEEANIGRSTIYGGEWFSDKKKYEAVDLNYFYIKSEKLTNKSKIQDAIKNYIMIEYPIHYIIPTVTDDLWFKNTLNGIRFIHNNLDQELYNKTGQDLEKIFKTIETSFKRKFNP